jgi:putrescine transport system permease protein
MVIFSAVRLGVSPQINALATILVAVVGVVVGAAFWLGRRR